MKAKLAGYCQIKNEPLYAEIGITPKSAYSRVQKSSYLCKNFLTALAAVSSVRLISRLSA